MNSRTLLVMLDIAHKGSAIALCEEARRYLQENDELHLAYVMPYGYFSYVEPYVSEENVKQAGIRAKDELNAINEAVFEAGTATLHVLRGGIGEQALLLVNKIGCDLLLLNAHQPEVKLHTLGSYAAQIVRHAPCSVLVRR